jgi:PAS domain S-box-containing protein
MATAAGRLFNRRDRARARGSASATLAKRRVTAALCILLFLLAAVLGIGVYATHELYRSAEDRYIGVVFPLRNATRDIVVNMVDEETGVRGYMITGDRNSLDPYFRGRDGVQEDLARITQLTRDRPELAARLGALRREIRALHGFYDRLITFSADSPIGLKQARDEVLNGKPLLDRFRRTSSLIQADIDRLVDRTRNEQRRTYDRAVGALGTAGLLALLIAVLLLIQVPERLRRLYAAEEHARVVAEQGANAARALSHVSDAVLLIDDAGIVRWWNDAAEALFGLTMGAAVGRPAAQVVPEYERLVEGGRQRDAFVPVRVEGDELWVAPALSTFENGSVLTIRDVTSRYLLERARADFVTTASHELRTPLTAIYGGVRTLLARSSALSEEQRYRLLHMIEQESAHLAQIVDQLLITAQLDRGSLHVTETPCDVEELCRSILEAAEARGSASDLVLDVGEDVGTLLCDESLLRQVLVNLVENAIKYSPDGGQIEVRAEGDRANVRISVSDHGLGIPASEHERVFEKFYRLDADMSRGVGGSGLGLYISREIVSQLDGTLTVDSAPGEGSTFTITLPRRDPVLAEAYSPRRL